MRSTPSYGCACLLLAGLITGCGPSPLAESWPELRPLGRDIDAYRPPALDHRDRESLGERVEHDNPRDRFQEPTGTLNLPDALAAALMGNPELAAFGWEVRAREAHALQRSLYPNPEAEVEIEGVGQRSDFDIGETTIRLAQPILTAGKLEKRTRVAELRSDLAGWDYEAKRLDVFTRVVRRFVSVLAAQRRLDVARQTYELAEQVYDTVSRQVEAGEVSSVEQTRAGVELSTNRIELQRTERALKSTRQALAATWGGVSPEFERAMGDLEEVSPVPPLEALAELVPQNPDIARWRTELAERRAEIELAEARAWPNITAQAGVKRLGATEELAPVLGVGLPLPIFDRNQGRILETRYNLAKAVQRRRAAVVDIRSELGQSYHTLEAAYDEVITLRDETLPRARSAYEAIRRSYREGRAEFLDVLDAQRTLFQVEQRYVEALREYHRTAAEIERLTGQSLEEVEPAIEAEPQIEPEPGPPSKPEMQPTDEGNTQ